MRDDGKSIIIITHKLNEVLSVSDRVAVLRKGEHIATVNTAETSGTELTEMMVGKKVVLNIDRAEPKNPIDRLTVSGLSLINKENVKVLDNVSFTARAGEILGIAGVAGSGQRELLEAIAGLQPAATGKITYFKPESNEAVNLRAKTPTQIREMGVRLSFVPEDRLGMGLVGNMDIVDNMMLRSYKKGKFFFVDRKKPKSLAENIIKSLEVATPGTNIPVRKAFGRQCPEGSGRPRNSLVAHRADGCIPMRGLDINSSYTIYNLLNKQKENGVAVIFVGEDLDVLIELCDRIMVICGGKITGIVDGRSANQRRNRIIDDQRKTNGAISVNSRAKRVITDEKYRKNLLANLFFK